MTIDRLHHLFLQHQGISTDTRKIKPGTIFFALKGNNFNGNEFATDALNSGASVAVVDDPGIPASEKIIYVKDVLQSLQELATFHRSQFSIPVLAITGTNGKTTTKELTYRVLSQKYNCISTEGNLNNHIGVPLTLLSITGQTEFAIIEMGANHAGEIDFLCRIANPDFGIITNIGKAHLEGFGSLEGVIRAKSELYRYLEKNKGTVFFNCENNLLADLAKGIPAVTYGSGQDASVRASEIVADPFVRMKISRGNAQIMVNSQLYGAYNYENILAAASIGFHFGVEPEKIIAAISSYQPANNRSQLIKTGHNSLVLDAYNANPSSMELAIKEFANNKPKNPVLILGDMLELGHDSEKEHRHILDLVKGTGIRNVYLVGPVFSQLNSERDWHCFGDCELARIWLEHHQVLDSSILIKGSRGIKLESLVPFL